MSTNTTTPAATADEQLGTLEYLHPDAVELEDNVRDGAVALRPEFLSSLREHGVIVPLTAIRDAQGRTLVREGQCRTLGARQVGLTHIPVLILTSRGADTAADTIDRIVHQLVANDHRSALTDAQRARGVQQMIDAGASITKIARKLSTHRDTVKAAAAVGKSPTALAALDTGQLSLTEAATIALANRLAIESRVTRSGSIPFASIRC
jgi:ParB family chromosome partitioning protein